MLDSGVHVGDDIVPMISARGYSRETVIWCSITTKEWAGQRLFAVPTPESFVSLHNDYGHDLKRGVVPEVAIAEGWTRSPGCISATFGAGIASTSSTLNVRSPNVIRESFHSCGLRPHLACMRLDCERFFMAEHAISEDEFWTTIT